MPTLTLATDQLLKRVGRQEAVNPYAVALILTEVTFRDSIFRLCETIYCGISIAVWGKDPNLTVGHCQVAFHFWRQRYGRRTLLLLLGTWNYYESYQVCCTFLSSRNYKSIRELLIAYNGRPSKLYVQRFAKNLSFVRKRLLELRLPASDALETSPVIQKIVSESLPCNPHSSIA